MRAWLPSTARGARAAAQPTRAVDQATMRRGAAGSTLLWLVALSCCVTRAAWAVDGSSSSDSDAPDTDVGTDAAAIPNPIRICVTPYAPFVMSSIYAAGNATLPGPVQLDTLNSALMVADGLHDPRSPSFQLTGFDIDYTDLVFHKILGVRILYVVRQTYLELYLALREGACDVGITAAELDWRRTTCNSNCSAVPQGGFDMSVLDYDMGYSSVLAGEDCCLEYGAPYYVSGFSLMSRPRKRDMNVKAALTSPHVVNLALTLLVMLLTLSWLVQGAEHLLGGAMDAPGEHAHILTSFYWAVTTMTTVGFGDVVPSSTVGRFLTTIWTVASFLTLSSLTATITTVLTADVLTSDMINALNEISGTMCVEQGYPLLDAYYRRDPQGPSDVIHDTVQNCLALLLAGRVQAVLGERPILTWVMSTYPMPSLHISPTLHVNPLAFVYRNGSALRPAVNPSVVAAQTDPSWVPLSEDITAHFFGLPQQVRKFEDVTPVHRPLVIAASVLAAVTLALQLAQQIGWTNAWGRWLFRTRVGAKMQHVTRRLLRQQLPAHLAAGASVEGRFEGGGTPEKRAPAAEDDAAPSGMRRSGSGATMQVMALLAELHEATAAQQEAARLGAARVEEVSARLAKLVADGGVSRASGLVIAALPLGQQESTASLLQQQAQCAV